MIAQLMVKSFPGMTRRKDNYQALKVLTKKVAHIADENLKNRSSPDILFDLTVTIVTHLAVQLGSPKFGGERRYCKWASDCFSKILQQNGAAEAMLAKDDDNADKDTEDASENNDDEE